MRKLNFKDFFVALRILSDLERDGTLSDLAKNAMREKANTGDADQMVALGLDMCTTLLFRAAGTETEKKIYLFLSGPFEKPPEQVSEMPLDEVLCGLRQLCRENDVLAFFRSAAAQVRKMSLTSGPAAIPV